MQEKYAFFAPIWRVMRDNNMSVEEVKEQVQYVALSVKQASQVSDLRHHYFSADKLQVQHSRGVGAGGGTQGGGLSVCAGMGGWCWLGACLLGLDLWTTPSGN